MEEKAEIIIDSGSSNMMKTYLPKIFAYLKKTSTA